VQENAKKLRNVATPAEAGRDDAVDVLKEEVFKARKFAQVRFAGDKAKLEEFKPIAKAGKRKSAAPSGETGQTPPEQPKQ
jgi:hypothetical protein